MVSWRAVSGLMAANLVGCEREADVRSVLRERWTPFYCFSARNFWGYVRRRGLKLELFSDFDLVSLSKTNSPIYQKYRSHLPIKGDDISRKVEPLRTNGVLVSPTLYILLITDTIV